MIYCCSADKFHVIDQPPPHTLLSYFEVLDYDRVRPDEAAGTPYCEVFTIQVSVHKTVSTTVPQSIDYLYLV